MQNISYRLHNKLRTVRLNFQQIIKAITTQQGYNRTTCEQLLNSLFVLFGIIILTKLPVVPPLVCHADEFRCRSPLAGHDKCIPASSRCNLVLDCDDGQDEMDCGRWQSTLSQTVNSLKFMCTNFRGFKRMGMFVHLDTWIRGFSILKGKVIFQIFSEILNSWRALLTEHTNLINKNDSHYTQKVFLLKYWSHCTHKTSTVQYCVFYLEEALPSSVNELL